MGASDEKRPELLGKTLTMDQVGAHDETMPMRPRGPADALRGTRVGRYVLGEPIGYGGMGVVYGARDPELGRELAVKLVLPQADDPRAQSRLLAEARAMARLRHPAVVPVFDVGTTAHGVYVVMPLVAGGTLHDWMHAEPQPWREVASRFLAAGRGLAAAHAAGLVHRDFKPRNVLIDSDGAVLVADFGLASEAAPATAAGDPDGRISSVAGTPGYMSPEQAAGKHVDARADQYSFCIAFWEGLHGKRPLDGPPPADREAPPDWLQLAIARGFAQDPAQRWPSMDALLDEIEQRSAGQLAPRRRRGLRIAILCAAGLGAAGAITYAIAWREPDKPDGVAGSTPGAPPEPALRLGAPRLLTTTGACAANPAFADAHTVVFDLTRDDAVDLFAVDLDASPPRALTSGGGWEWRARPGRRPREVLFLGTDPKEPTRSYLAFADLDHLGERDRVGVIATGISTVGDEVYYADRNGTELRVRRGATDELVGNYPRTALGVFAIDPGTMRIAYTGYRTGPVCHHRLPAEAPRCTADHVNGQAPAFSARGDAIYFGASDGVRHLDVASGRETVVIAADASGGVAIAPDHRHLAYSSCATRGRLIDVLRPEVALVDDPDVRSPAIGPRGLLAWVRVTGAAPVLMVRAEDGVIRQLTSPALGGVVDPVFDPAGERIAFEVIGPQPGVYVAAIDPNRASVIRVTSRQGDGRPAWFDAGKLMFRRTDEGGISHAYTIDLDGGEPAELAGRSRPPLAANPVTHEILAIGTAAGKLSWSTTLGRERPGPRGAPPSMQSASISPSGRWLLVQSGVSGNVMLRAALPGGALEKFYEEKGGHSLGQAVIDDDGRVFAASVGWRGELFAVQVEAGSL